MVTLDKVLFFFRISVVGSVLVRVAVDATVFTRDWCCLLLSVD